MWIRLKSNEVAETLIHAETGARIKTNSNDFGHHCLTYIYADGKGWDILDGGETNEEIKREFEKIAEGFRNKGELIDLRK